MKTSIVQIGLTTVIILLANGCAIRHGDFTVLSNKVVRLSEFELGKAERTRDVTGKDVDHIISFIPTGVPTLEEAVDDALEEGNGDVITDAVIYYRWWYIPYIYGQSSWTVSGDVVKTRKN